MALPTFKATGTGHEEPIWPTKPDIGFLRISGMNLEDIKPPLGWVYEPEMSGGGELVFSKNYREPIGMTEARFKEIGQLLVKLCACGGMFSRSHNEARGCPVHSAPVYEQDTIVKALADTFNRLDEVLKDRDEWKRRAAAHGCDTDKGDIDCG